MQSAPTRARRLHDDDEGWEERLFDPGLDEDEPEDDDEELDEDEGLEDDSEDEEEEELDVDELDL